MFDKKSRYAKQEMYAVTDGRGRTVNVVVPPNKPTQSLRGYHQRKQGQRIDHMAYKYLHDNTGFWRIAEFNDAMHLEILSEADEIAIPNKN